MSYTGTIKVNGNTYNVEVRNGQRYIDGMTVEEFTATLDSITVAELAAVGQRDMRSNALDAAKDNGFTPAEG